MYFLKLSLMFALINFSKMKLIKTRLRNQRGNLSVDSLFRISTEGPEKFQDDEYEFFVD